MIEASHHLGEERLDGLGIRVDVESGAGLSTQGFTENLTFEPFKLVLQRLDRPCLRPDKLSQ